MSEVVPESSHRPARTVMSSIQGAWLVGLLAAVLVLLWFTGESGRELLRYERAAVLQGQYWRLLTGHLVHGSGQHLLLNAVGLGLIAALFPREYSLRGWLLILASSVVTIDLGFGGSHSCSGMSACRASCMAHSPPARSAGGATNPEAWRWLFPAS